MKNNKGVWIPDWLIREDLSWTERILIAEISQLEMLDKGCIASNVHFSEKLGISRQGVSNALGQLAKKEWIVVDNDQTKRNFGRKITIHSRVSTIHERVHTIHGRVESKENNTMNNTENKTNCDLEDKNQTSSLGDPTAQPEKKKDAEKRKKEILDLWNGYVLKSRVKNTTIKVGENIFTKCRKITPDLEKEINRVLRSYDLEDVKSSFEAYAYDRVGRDPEQDFAKHSFSLFEFFKRGNAFPIFVNK